MVPVDADDGPVDRAAERASGAAFLAVQVAAWALLCTWSGWRGFAVAGWTFAWLLWWAVFFVGDVVQAWVWRRVRGRAGGGVADRVPSGDSGG